MAGWFKLYRGWMDSAVFANEALTEREAWLWLLENAHIDETTINIRNEPVTLSRGELSHSIRFLADKWQWKSPRVKRFLNKLEKWRMIDTATTQGQTKVTICNYTKYQDKRNSSEQPTDTAATQLRHSCDTKKEEGKKGRNEEGKNIGDLNAKKSNSYPDDFEQWYQNYPHKVGKGQAYKAWKSAIQKADLHTLIQAVDRYKQNKPPDIQYCNPSTWLNQERWLDEPAQNNGENNGTARRDGYDPGRSLEIALQDQTRRPASERGSGAATQVADPGDLRRGDVLDSPASGALPGTTDGE